MKVPPTTAELRANQRFTHRQTERGNEKPTGRNRPANMLSAPSSKLASAGRRLAEPNYFVKLLLGGHLKRTSEPGSRFAYVPILSARLITTDLKQAFSQDPCHLLDRLDSFNILCRKKICKYAAIETEVKRFLCFCYRRY